MATRLYIDHHTRIGARKVDQVILQEVPKQTGHVLELESINKEILQFFSPHPFTGTTGFAILQSDSLQLTHIPTQSILKRRPREAGLQKQMGIRHFVEYMF